VTVPPLPATVTLGVYIFCEAGHNGAVQVVVLLVGVSVWPLMLGGGLLPIVSGFQLNGGGGTPLLGFSTEVHEVTESVVVPPGCTVPGGGLKVILHDGACARGKLYVVFANIGRVTGFETPDSTTYPAGTVRVRI